MLRSIVEFLLCAFGLQLVPERAYDTSSISFATAYRGDECSLA